MPAYFELLTDTNHQQWIQQQGRASTNYQKESAMMALLTAQDSDPMESKMDLATNVIADFHGTAASEKARHEFQRVFRDRQVPEELRQIKVKRAFDGTYEAYEMQGAGGRLIAKIDFPLLGKEKWSKLLVAIKEIGSVSEAERLIKGGGFEINQQVITDPTAKVNLGQYGDFNGVIRMGKKKQFRLIIE
jgi:tyrosyl-tRNA synthetase